METVAGAERVNNWVANQVIEVEKTFKCLYCGHGLNEISGFHDHPKTHLKPKEERSNYVFCHRCHCLKYIVGKFRDKHQCP